MVTTRRMSRNSTTFRFRALPPELRNRIYKNLLEVDGDLFVYDNHGLRVQYRNRRSHHGEKPDITVGLLRTCRQIHAEATTILYGCNTFGASTQAVNFLQGIGASIRHIRSFSLVKCRPAHIQTVCKLLTGAPSLKQITSTIQDSAFLVKELSPLLRHLDKAWKRDPGKKARNVLDIVAIDPGLVTGGRAQREHTIAQAQEFEDEIKALLGKKLKPVAQSKGATRRSKKRGR